MRFATLVIVLALTATLIPVATARTCVEGTADICLGSYREDVCRFSGATVGVDAAAIEAGAYRRGTPEGLYASAESAEGSILSFDWSGSGSCVVYANAGGVHESVSGAPCPKEVVAILAILA